MRALIVDDSSFIRRYMQELLTSMDITSEQAEDGCIALQRLDRPPPAVGFDIALVDLNMPRMGGMELVRSVRSMERFAPMKLMMVTTEAAMVFVSSALRLGADEFLMKPFSPESLKEKLRMLGLVES